jgi:CheY-like chemotaxis protein/two-component sensor histidine kinase
MLREQNAELMDARNKAKAAGETRTAFLANMSHELRTPLNAILGFSRLLREDAGISEEQRERLEIIHRSGMHLQDAVNDVVEIARADGGLSPAEDRTFDLAGLLSDVRNMMRGPAEEKGLDLIFTPADSLPRFVGSDAAKLRHILINLIGNAIHSTRRGSVIVSLEAKTADTPEQITLILTVADTGIGIAAEDLTHIFEPFTQTVRAGGGNLGLPVTRQYVELMGGKIGVESQPGKGSTFRVELPVRRAAAPDAGDAPRPMHRRVAPGQPEYRILIVEDNADNRLLLQQLLRRAGFDVRTAGDGAEGIEVFRIWRPHWIWMDLRMPGIDGLEATRRIRAMEGGADVKIVALTASVISGQREQVIEAGMDEVVEKPYQQSEIFDCMARHLGLRYVLDASGAEEAERGAPQELSPQAVAALPQDLRGRLLEAVISLEMDRISETIREVADVDAELGSAMARIAGRLEYTRLLHALQGSGGRRAGGAA